MPDKLKIIYDSLVADSTVKGLPKTYDQFYSSMQDPAKSQVFYNSLRADPNIKGLPDSYDDFVSGLAIKAGGVNLDPPAPIPAPAYALADNDEVNTQIKGILGKRQIGTGFAGIPLKKDTENNSVLEKEAFELFKKSYGRDITQQDLKDFKAGRHVWNPEYQNMPKAPAKTPSAITNELKQAAIDTRDSLISAREKLDYAFNKKFKFPTTTTMQPGGQGTLNWESKEQADAYYTNDAKKKKLDLAITYLDRAINTPESKEGAGIMAFQNEGQNIISAGVMDMLEKITTAQTAKQIATGQGDEEGQALIDAYGKLQQLNAIATQDVPRYRRASSVAGSIPYMEQFFATGGIGTAAEGTAITATKAITKGITNKALKSVAARLIQPTIEGGVSMIGRVPLSPATFKNISEESIGKLKEVDGKFYVDPAAMPSISKAIAKGTYGSAKEIFSESLGGMLAIPQKWLGKTIFSEAISPGVKQFFKQVGMNNPVGEYWEEMVSQALGGENPVDPQFLKDLVLTIPIITGGFSALSAPSIAKNLKINYDNNRVLKIFGEDTVKEISDLIESEDHDALITKLYNIRTEGANYKDYDHLVRYAASRVQEKAAAELSTPDKPGVNTSTGPLDVPLTQEERDINNIKDVADRLKYNGTDQIVFASEGEMKDGQLPLVIVSEKPESVTGKNFATVIDLNELQQAKWDITKVTPRVISGDQLRTERRKTTPYQQFLNDEIGKYYSEKQEADNFMAQQSAPVQEGQEIQLKDKLFNVTRVTTDGVVLNEIDEQGNLSPAELTIPSDQYEATFGTPAAQTEPVATGVTETGEEVPIAQTEVTEAAPAPQIPVNKKGEVDYDVIKDPVMYAQGLTQEFGEDAGTVLSELIAEKQQALQKASEASPKAASAIEKHRKVKANKEAVFILQEEIAMLNKVKEQFPEAEAAPEEVKQPEEVTVDQEVQAQEQPIVEQTMAQTPSAPDETVSEIKNVRQEAGEMENVKASPDQLEQEKKAIADWFDSKGVEYISIDWDGNVAEIFKGRDERVVELTREELIEGGVKLQAATENVPEEITLTGENRLRAIEQEVSDMGYSFQIDADSDPDYTSVNVYEGPIEGNKNVDIEKLPAEAKKLFDEYTKLVHNLKIAVEEQPTADKTPSEMTLPEFAKWYAVNGSDPQTRFRASRHPDGNDGFVRSAWIEATQEQNIPTAEKTPEVEAKEETPVETKPAQEAPAPAKVVFFPNAKLKGKMVTIKTTNAETGEVETMRTNAFALQKQLRKRNTILQKLKDCVG